MLDKREQKEIPKEEECAESLRKEQLTKEIEVLEREYVNMFLDRVKGLIDEEQYKLIKKNTYDNITKKKEEIKEITNREMN